MFFFFFFNLKIFSPFFYNFLLKKQISLWWFYNKKKKNNFVNFYQNFNIWNFYCDSSLINDSFIGHNWHLILSRFTAANGKPLIYHISFVYQRCRHNVTAIIHMMAHIPMNLMAAYEILINILYLTTAVMRLR